MKGTLEQMDDELSKSAFAPGIQTVEEETMGHFLRWKAYNLFVDNIPLAYIQSLPVTYAVAFGIIAYIISIAALVYFTVSGYIQTMKEQFISLDKGAGACS
jgi:hypothetical protein